MKTFLIVSSGRTGTQFLAHYFQGNFEGVVAVHEPRPRIATRLLANAWAGGAVPRVVVTALLRARAREIARLPGRLYVESNPFLWGAVDLFDDVFDDPTVVHVVRDPRTQVRSSLNHGTAAGAKGIANRWVPFWHPPLRSLATVGLAPDGFERAAGLWTVVNARLRRAGEQCRRYHLIRYEELFDDRQSGLQRLCALLGLELPAAGAPVDPRVPRNVGARDVLPNWENWSGAQCSALERICGALMREYGYGVEAAWRDRVAAGATNEIGKEPW